MATSPPPPSRCGPGSPGTIPRGKPMPHPAERQRTQAPLAVALLTRTLVARSAALRAKLCVVIDQSREAVRQSRETVWQSRVVALSAYPHVSAIAGGSAEPDAALIAAAITDAALCAACIG